MTLPASGRPANGQTSTHQHMRSLALRPQRLHRSTAGTHAGALLLFHGTTILCTRWQTRSRRCDRFRSIMHTQSGEQSRTSRTTSSRRVTRSSGLGGSGNGGAPRWSKPSKTRLSRYSQKTSGQQRS